MPLRPARQGDLDLAAGWLGLEEAPASWTSDLELGASFALEMSGGPVAVCLLRPWGRVLVAPLFLVEPGRRGLGHGRALTAAVREEALRREALRSATEASRAFVEIALEQGIKHREWIERFGRFPHRNEALGRISSEEELAFLATWAQTAPPRRYRPALP